jgi:hypothetical protein
MNKIFFILLTIIAINTSCCEKNTNLNIHRRELEKALKYISSLPTPTIIKINEAIELHNFLKYCDPKDREKIELIITNKARNY